MPHNALIGKTRCGKTSLAIVLAADLKRRGIGVAVLDPFFNKWPCQFQTSDPEQFLQALPRIVDTRKRWALFVDESSHALDRHDPRMSFLGTGAAQAGLVTYFLAQRDRQLNPEVRNSIETWWIFNNADASRMASDLDAQQIANVRSFPKGRFYLYRPFRPLIEGQLSWGRKTTVALKLAPTSTDESSERKSRGAHDVRRGQTTPLAD